MSDFKKDIISALVFLALGIGVLISVPLTIQDPGISVMGPRVFPNFIGVCMVLLSTVLLATTLLKARKDPAVKAEKEKSKEEKAADLKNELRALAMAGIALLYACTFEPLGYFVSTFIAVTLSMLLFKVKKWWAYPLLYAIAFLIWLAFTTLLSVRLP